MKKVIVIFLFIASYCSAQDFKPYFFKVSEMIAKSYNSYFNNFGLSFGKTWILNKESTVDIDMSYRYSVNLKGFKSPSYIFKKHILGGSIDYTFWLREKRLRPFIGLSIHSEVSTNYINGLLKKDGNAPTDKYSLIGNTRSARWYKGTPFVGNFFFGFNIKLIPSLYLKTAFGLGYERIKSKSLTWVNGEVENPLLESDKQPMKVSAVFSWNLLVGLRYEFSFGGKL